MAVLLGAGWRHFYRFPHSAYELRGGRLMPLGWATVAARRGGRADLRTAAWHDVSGFRLHHPRPDPAFGEEPRVGPVPEVLGRVLESLRSETDGGAGEVAVAEWTGFDESAAGRALEGSRFTGTEVVVGLSHSVWRTSLTSALALVRAGDRPGLPIGQAVLADVVWSSSGRWITVSSPDLASTYCGTSRPVTGWDPSLEWVEVDPIAPVS